MINTESKSMLAKLLAHENVSIEYGNYPTAAFDILNRKLMLPLWTDMSKHLEDLLVGHEVGHALFTTKEGWHESVVDLGIPRGYVNVIEDIRIEKLMERKYPGLSLAFKKGYRELIWDRDFFKLKEEGLESVSSDDMSLINRLNVKSKGRDNVEVAFKLEEQTLVERAFGVETFDDVKEVALELYKFCKEESANDDSDSSGEQGSIGEEEVDSDGAPGDTINSQEETVETEANKNDGSSEGEEEEEGEETSSSGGRSDMNDPEKVSTDENYRESEQDLINTSSKSSKQPLYFKTFSDAQYDDMLVLYPELKKSRELYDKYYTGRNAYHKDSIEVKYAKFKTETKFAVGVMAKEFELKKSAYRSARAVESRAGTLNVNKLHSYKFNDDIFKKVTNMSDGKSHGVVMLVDYSSSMCGVISDVIKQTLTLVSFCKTVNIPFEVYGFTSGSRAERGGITFSAEFVMESSMIHHDSTKFFELINSNMRTAVFTEAYNKLFESSVHLSRSTYGTSKIESMGGTPLKEVLVAMEKTFQRFQKKHKVEKMNFVLLTDGLGRHLSVATSYDIQKNLARDEYATHIDNKLVTFHDNTFETEYLDVYRKMGVNVVGFFILRSYKDINYALYPIKIDRTDYFWAHRDEVKAMKNKIRKEKFLSFDDVSGYDRYFIMKGNTSSDTSNEEFQIEEDATKSQIRNAYKKHSGSKKYNKLISIKFAEIVS
jgi:hypothetical protein